MLIIIAKSICASEILNKILEMHKWRSARTSVLTTETFCKGGIHEDNNAKYYSQDKMSFSISPALQPFKVLSMKKKLFPRES